MSCQAKPCQATPALQDDTRGAVMVIAVFMAMIAIGALYYMVGLGDAILAQERMQDAADASAFSGAVIHARGMNILALLNIIMAALLAILVLLSMLSSLFKAITVVLVAISWLIPAAVPLISPANTASRGFAKAEENAKKPVYRTLKALHALQEPINKAVPALASLNAAKLSSSNYGDVVTVGITFPIFKGLPTTNGSFKTLCRKAGEYVGSLLVVPIEAAMGGSNLATKMLIPKAKGLGRSYADFYCGDGPKPAAPVFSEKVSIPELSTPERLTCETTGDKDVCERYDEQLKRLKDSYDFEKGKCKAHDEYINDKWVCDGLKRKARRECNPKNRTDIKDFTWVERRYTRHFTLEGEGDNRYVKEHDITSSTPRYKERNARANFSLSIQGLSPVPCGWSKMTKWDESKAPVEPLCETKFKKPDLKFFTDRGITSHDEDIVEVTDVLRCTVVKKIVAELNGEPMKASDKESMAPQEMCSCAKLGEEDFQVRAVVLGDAKKYTKDADKKILVATQGQASQQSPIQNLATYGGRVAAAQAEYYFDGRKGPEEWLWHLKWKARMRRLAPGRKAFQCKVKDTCSKSQMGFGEGLDEIVNSDQKEKLSVFKRLLSKADSIIVH